MILTPRGITIYLQKNYAFGLMARIYPSVNPFQVLEKTQGIYRIHSATAFIVGMICFLTSLSPINIGIITFVAIMVSFLMRIFGIFFIPGIVIVPTLFSRYTGFGLYYLALLIVGLVFVGFWGTVSFFLARIITEGLTMFIENISGKRIGIMLDVDQATAKAGAMYFAPVRDFFNAYRLYALKYGASLDLKLSDEELKNDNWFPVWENLQKNWPMVANRFPQLD